MSLSRTAMVVLLTGVALVGTRLPLSANEANEPLVDLLDEIARSGPCIKPAEMLAVGLTLAWHRDRETAIDAARFMTSVRTRQSSWVPERIEALTVSPLPEALDLAAHHMDRLSNAVIFKRVVTSGEALGDALDSYLDAVNQESGTQNHRIGLGFEAAAGVMTTTAEWQAIWTRLMTHPITREALADPLSELGSHWFEVMAAVIDDARNLIADHDLMTEVIASIGVPEAQFCVLSQLSLYHARRDLALSAEFSGEAIRILSHLDTQTISALAGSELEILAANLIVHGEPMAADAYIDAVIKHGIPELLSWYLVSTQTIPPNTPTLLAYLSDVLEAEGNPDYAAEISIPLAVREGNIERATQLWNQIRDDRLKRVLGISTLDLACVARPDMVPALLELIHTQPNPVPEGSLGQDIISLAALIADQYNDGGLDLLIMQQTRDPETPLKVRTDFIASRLWPQIKTDHQRHLLLDTFLNDQDDILDFSNSHHRYPAYLGMMSWQAWRAGDHISAMRLAAALPTLATPDSARQHQAELAAWYRARMEADPNQRETILRALIRDLRPASIATQPFPLIDWTPEDVSRWLWRH